MCRSRAGQCASCASLGEQTPVEPPFWKTTSGEAPPVIRWHGTQLDKPDWGFDSRSLAFELTDSQYDERLYIVFNAYWKPLTFALPVLSDEQQWKRVADTALASPEDFQEPAQAVTVHATTYRVEARSAIILLAG